MVQTKKPTHDPKRGLIKCDVQARSPPAHSHCTSSSVNRFRAFRPTNKRSGTLLSLKYPEESSHERVGDPEITLLLIEGKDDSHILKCFRKKED